MGNSHSDNNKTFVDRVRQSIYNTNNRPTQPPGRAPRTNPPVAGWPATSEPKLYTETPIPAPLTNPPVVIPGSSTLPPNPKLTDPPAKNNDEKAMVGTDGSADYRPDLGEYNLVIVKDKDIPDNSGYNPRAMLRFFPKGHLMGSNETFYVVTHRFADRAGINESFRGDLVLKADSRGRPSHPLMAEDGGAGGIGPLRENVSGSDESIVSKEMLYGIVVLLVVLLLLQTIYCKNIKEGI